MLSLQKAHPSVTKPLNPAFYREFDALGCTYPAVDSQSEIESTAFKAEVLGYDSVVPINSLAQQGSFMAVARLGAVCDRTSGANRTPPLKRQSLQANETLFAVRRDGLLNIVQIVAIASIIPG
jgi:hypothetical protein